MEEPFWKQKLQSRIAFLEVHFIAFKMVILETLFLLVKKIFFWNGHSLRVFISLRNTCFGNKSKTQNRNANSRKKSWVGEEEKKRKEEKKIEGVGWGSSKAGRFMLRNGWFTWYTEDNGRRGSKNLGELASDDYPTFGALIW